MATIPSPLVSNEREIQPMQLSLEQLNYFKTQHEEEIIELSKQLEALVGAKNRYLSAKATISEVQAAPEGNPMLVPLTSSLYVPGTVFDKDKLIVELGTGYFVEKTIPDAKDLIERKLVLVAKSIESVESVTAGKRRTLDQLMMVMNYKINMAKESRAAAAGAAR